MPTKIKIAWVERIPFIDQRGRLRSRVVPPNCRGVCVMNQAEADEFVPLLLQTQAAVRFLLIEPMLGPVDLNRVSKRLPSQSPGAPNCGAVVMGSVLGDTDGRSFSPRGAAGRGIDWVIVGGESGPGARPCDIAWIRSIVEQCKAASVSCFVKQLGSNIENNGIPWPNAAWAAGVSGMKSKFRLNDSKGGAPEEWPADLRVRQFPRQR